GKLEIELTVERGRGYVSASQNKSFDAEIGRIPVDSIYSPVLKVTYKVEATRVEQRTDFDKLVVDVETKPAISPRDALASAGKTLVELFGLARELNVEAEGIEIGPSPTDAALAADLALPIEELGLQSRSYNCLKREGIHSVGELVARSEADLPGPRHRLRRHGRGAGVGRRRRGQRPARRTPPTHAYRSDPAHSPHGPPSWRQPRPRAAPAGEPRQHVPLVGGAATKTGAHE